MASLQVDEMTHEPEETTELSPNIEENILSPADQDIVTPPTESETMDSKEIVPSDEEQEKKLEKEEEEETPEMSPINEKSAPAASVEEGSGHTHDFTEEDDEDEDEDEDD